MNKLVLVVAVAGCWSSSSSDKQAQEPVVVTAPSHGGATYGGAMYGGVMYGGATYGVLGQLRSTSGAFGSLTGTGDIDDTDVYGGLIGNEVGEMQGGWGYGTSGLGPGGGGTGGTIGTGSYGTIGHGSGTGSGYGKGGVAGGRKGAPVARIGNATAGDGLDKNIIRRYIRRQIRKITYCYEKELVVKPDLQGRVVVDFTIGVDGKVTSSTASGLHQNVDGCVAASIKEIEFPKPNPARPVVVRYPFVFSPG